MSESAAASGRKPRSRTQSIRTPYDTEFSVVLAALVKEIQGSVGAVLTDISGEPIDYVHMPNELAELDVQIAGAQIVQIVAETQEITAKWKMGTGVLLVEGSRAAFLAAMVAGEYLLTVVLGAEANLARGLRSFEEAMARLEEYLG